MSTLRTFKGVLVGKGSALSEALSLNDKGKAAEKVFKATTVRFQEIYGAEDCNWFMAYKVNSQ